jgi:hypothetical protein
MREAYSTLQQTKGLRMIPKKPQRGVDVQMASPRASVAFSALETVRSLSTFLRSLLDALRSKLQTNKRNKVRSQGNFRPGCRVSPAVSDIPK